MNPLRAIVLVALTFLLLSMPLLRADEQPAAEGTEAAALATIAASEGSTDAAARQPQTIRVFSLSHIKAETLAKQLQVQFAAEVETKGIRFNGSPKDNSLIVTSDPETLKRVAEAMREFDQPGTEAADIKVFGLSHGDAGSLLKVMNNLIPLMEKDPKIPLRFAKDPRSNSLIAIGRAEALQRVEGAVLAYDQPAAAKSGAEGPDSTTASTPDLGPARRVLLRFVSADEAAEALKKLHPDLMSRAHLATGPGRLDLFIRGNEVVKDQLLDAIAQIDTPEEGRSYDVKIIQAFNTRAAPVKALLIDLYGKEPVTIGADERTNSIILKGPGELLKVLEAIVLRLDEGEAFPVAEGAQAPAGRSAAARGNPELEREKAASEYRQHEGEATDWARAARGFPVANREDADRLKEIRGKLAAEVAAAFDARQRLQSAEIMGLRIRLEQLEQTIKGREQLKPQIIQRRVEELLHSEQQRESEANSFRTARSTPADSGGKAAGGSAGGRTPNELLRQQLQQRLLEAQVELELQQARLVAGGNKARRDPPAKELNEALAADVTYQKLSTQRSEIAKQLAEMKRRFSSGGEAPSGRIQSEIEKSEAASAKLDDELESRHAAILASLHEQARQSEEADVADAHSRLDSQRVLVDVLQRRIAELGDADSRQPATAAQTQPREPVAGGDHSEGNVAGANAAIAGDGSSGPIESVRNADPRLELFEARQDLARIIATRDRREAEAITRLKEKLAFTTSMVKKGYATHTELAADEAALARAEAAPSRTAAEIAAAQRRVSQARETLRNHVKLLEIDVADAKLALERATIDEQSASRLRNLPKPIISPQEYDIQRVARDRAALAVQRAETRLAPYTAALSESESESVMPSAGGEVPLPRVEGGSANPQAIASSGDPRLEWLDACNRFRRLADSHELTSAEAELAAARAKVERVSRLAKTGAVPATVIETAQAEQRQAEARHNQVVAEATAAERRLVHAREALENHVKLLELDLRAAAVDLEVAEAKEAKAIDANRKFAGAITKSEIDIFRLTREKARIALERAKTQLELHKAALSESASEESGPPGKAPAGKPQSAFPQQSQNDVVARVGDQPLSWEDLAAESIARHGKDILDNLIDRKIVEQACAAGGIEVSEAEVNAEVYRLAKKFGMDAAAYLAMLERERNISEATYKRNIVWPMLALRKLSAEEITITRDELQRAFVRNYGVRVKARVIVLDDARRAAEVWKLANDNPADFEALARKHSVDNASRHLGGTIPPISFYGGSEGIEKAAFKLKDDEISPVIQTEPGKFMILKCEGRTPVVVERMDPEIEAILREQLQEQKVADSVARTFEKLKKAARVERQLSQQPAAKQ